MPLETGFCSRSVLLKDFKTVYPGQCFILTFQLNLHPSPSLNVYSPLPTTTISTYGDFLASAHLESQWLFPVLADVKDPMNLGAILRSSAFFGLHQLLLLGEGGMRKVSPVVSKVIKSIFVSFDILFV